MAMVGVASGRVAAYRRTHNPGRLAWSDGRRPLDAVPYPSNELAEPSQWLCHDDSTINTVLVIVTIIIVVVDCPANFTYVPSVRGCYHIVLDRMTWVRANEYCISLHKDAHLVIVNNQAEQTVLSDMLYKQRSEQLSFLFTERCAACFSLSLVDINANTKSLLVVISVPKCTIIVC